MRGSRGIVHSPFSFTYVGRLVVAKKFSGSTPFAGAGTNVASGALARALVRWSGNITNKLLIEALLAGHRATENTENDGILRGTALALRWCCVVKNKKRSSGFSRCSRWLGVDRVIFHSNATGSRSSV